MNDPGSNRMLQWFCRKEGIALLLFLIALIPRIVFPLATTICYDEMAAKDSGSMLQLLKKGDFRSEEWAQYPYLPFYKYIYGLVPQVLWGSDPSDPDDLAGARWMGALFGSAIIVVTFLIGTCLMPVPAAALGALLLAFFPTVLGHDRIAMHDAPSRLLILLSGWQLLQWNPKGARRYFFRAAIFTGLAVTFFHRTGITGGLALVLWLVCFLWSQPMSFRQRFNKLFLFGIVSLTTFLASVWLLWPYVWFRPWEIIRWYADPAATAAAGGASEYWFGRIQPVPMYYYFVALLVSTPPLTLLAFAGWQFWNWRKIWAKRSWLILVFFSWIPLFVCSFTLRQGLAHYLQILFPALCLGAAAGIWQVRSWIALRFANLGRSVQWGIISIPVLMEISACVQVNPYFFEYLNIFTGGGANVTEKRLLAQGFYGEAVGPLFDYLRRNGKPGSTVLCRLGPWPGLSHLVRYLGPDFRLQGYQMIDPLGPQYILRAGMERYNEYYRHEPNPQFYQKVMDVLADGGSLGEVWERRADLAFKGLLYSDDFSSPQFAQFTVAAKNLDLNQFSDGKIYSTQSGAPSALIMKFPSILFRGRTVVFCEADVQMRQGSFRILTGANPKELQEVAQITGKRDTVRSSEFKVDSGKEFYIAFEWMTTHAWDGSPASFWEADWVDAFRIFAKTK